jgi:hypothetical protein
MKCLIPVLIFLTIVPVLGQDYTADSTFDAIDTLRQDFGIFDSEELLNILTDYSFRVRLAKIEYINTGKRSKTISTYCFFIEPIGRLTERTNTVPVNSTTLRQQNWTLQDRGGFYKSIA